LDQHLAKSKRDFFASSDFSLVDINFMPLTHMLIHGLGEKDLFAGRDTYKAWWDNVSARPSWQKVVANLDEAYSHLVPDWKA
jgi:glutathione S-transferase